MGIKYATRLACLLFVIVVATGCGDDGNSSAGADARAAVDAAIGSPDGSSTADATPAADADPDAPDADPAAPDGSTAALCAEPGAVGNSMGVGLYCQVDSDCSGQAAGLCTVAQQADAPPFCTKVCFGIDPNECGENASCDGDGVLRGCVPNCILN